MNNVKTFTWMFVVVLLFSFLGGNAFPQRVGDFVKYEELIDYSMDRMRLAKLFYGGISYNISIFKRGEKTVVRFDPIILEECPFTAGLGGVELYFTEVQRGYVYEGGVIQK